MRAYGGDLTTGFGHIDPEQFAMRSEVDVCHPNECARQPILWPTAVLAKGLRSIRPECRTRFAEMTNVIATDAPKRLRFETSDALTECA